jgi:hypothetical protein
MTAKAITNDAHQAGKTAFQQNRALAELPFAMFSDMDDQAAMVAAWKQSWKERFGEEYNGFEPALIANIEIRQAFKAMAEAPWIDTASREELEELFIWVKADEDVIPPDLDRYPSRLMLQLPKSLYSDEDLRTVGKLARHLTAAGDLDDHRNSGRFSHVRKEDGYLFALRISWIKGGRRCESIEEAAGVLMSNVEADLTALQPMLDSFDAEHGHGPAPRP